MSKLRAQVFSYNPQNRREISIEKEVEPGKMETLKFIVKTPTASQRDQIMEALKPSTDKTIKSPSRALATAIVLCTYHAEAPDQLVFSKEDIELFMEQPDHGFLNLLGSEIFDMLSEVETHVKKL
jgi:hypothetical protein